MITSAQYSVTSTAVKLAPADGGYRDVHVHVVGNGSIYLGTSAVTTSTGFYLDKGAGPQVFRLDPQDDLWAVASGSQTTTVLIVGP
jgi:hypothetical protein